MSKHQTLLAKAADAAKAARTIAEKAHAENRPLSTSERAQFDAKFREATETKAAADRAKTDESVMTQANDLARLIGMPHGAGGSAGSHWAKDSAERIFKAMPGPDGQKALVSGTVGVANVIDPEVVRIGTVPTAILDLMEKIPDTSPGMGGNTFSYLRETVRTNNAAPVADGALKPTSVFTAAEVEDRYRVIAHLSEPTPIRYFTDYSLLEDFLRAEMEYGLELALEAQVVSGAGTGENFTGLLNTSGTLSVAAVTGDLIATLRKAITQLQVNGTPGPTAFVLNPTDAEKLDLVREGASTGQYLLGGPGSKTDQTLWSIPRVASTAVTAGTAILGDWNYAKLIVREGANVALDFSGDNFTKNLATMRVEGRYGLAIKRPAAFAKITLP